MKNEGALRMRFSRQGGIYRSDVFSLLVNPVQMPPPVGRPRYRAIGRAGRSNTPCPSSAMSSALAIPQRVARQHCPSPVSYTHLGNTGQLSRALSQTVIT